jgi:hypothetical protein
MRFVMLGSAWPNLAETTATGTPLDKRLVAFECRSECRLASLTSFPQASHDHLGNQIGTEVVSLGLAKDQIQVFVITREKTPVLCLLLAEELKGRYRTLREFKMPRFLALRGFDPQAGHRLFE